MARFLFDDSGDAFAFVRGRYVHGLDGRALAQVSGSQVHRLSGEHVGEIYGDMVVDRDNGGHPAIAPADIPARVTAPTDPGNRGLREVTYRDVSHRLLD
jgi:hypothetical protein